MATPHLPPPASRRALKKIGRDLRMARLNRNLTAEQVADKANTSRNTINRIEAGDPAVRFGIVVSVLQVLGFLEPLTMVADQRKDETGLMVSASNLRKRASGKRTENKLKALVDGK